MMDPMLFREILDAIALARAHALRLAEDFPEQGEALRRFSKELKQAQEELFLRIFPGSEARTNESG